MTLTFSSRSTRSWPNGQQKGGWRGLPSNGSMRWLFRHTCWPIPWTATDSVIRLRWPVSAFVLEYLRQHPLQALQFQRRTNMPAQAAIRCDQGQISAVTDTVVAFCFARRNERETLCPG